MPDIHRISATYADPSIFDCTMQQSINPWFRLISTTVFAVFAMMMGPCFGQELSLCDNETVTYSPFDEHFAEKMTVQPGPAPRSVMIMGDKQFTNLRTRWLTVRRPDYAKAGPWATVVSIGDRSGSSLIELAFLDHASGGVNIHWLNEKLLYGSVGWGRIVSTDFVFDVEKKTFIYREMANYGELVQPCR
jgi:hypothetical protein